VIKVLTGQRRAGKSYILYQLMGELKEFAGTNVIYVNTEFADYRHIRTDTELYGFVNSRLKKRKKNYVFIDEIQEIRGFELALRSLFAEGRCDLYCTGSNAHLLSGELATYLAGRYIEIRVHPLSYVEFLDFYGLKNSTAALERYLRIGGMPYLASLVQDGEREEAAFIRHENLAFEYLRNLYESILFRDVIAREKVRNVYFLENLVAYLADNMGSLFSANNISNYLKSQRIAIPVQTVISYLEVLEKSCLVHRVRRSDVRGLKIFEIGEKYYFEDPGIRNSLTRGKALEGPKLVEQAVYLFLVQRGFSVTIGKLGGNGKNAGSGDPYSREIDFVGEKSGEKIYVQAAYRITDDKTYKREFGNLEMIGDQFPKYVVTMDDDMPKVNARGIRWAHVKDFLTVNL
jgi:predicted AAA+ superfamily ATPase